MKLRKAGLGCRISDIFCGALFYEDDIVLLSGSVVKLQAMFDNCNEYGMIFDIKFNVDKSLCLKIGDGRWNAPINLMLDGRELYWEKELKYLGVKILVDKTFTISYANNKRKFYATCAAILQKSVYIKISIYDIVVTLCNVNVSLWYIIAAKINLTLLRELNVMVNLVIRRVFNIPKFVSVRDLYIQYNVQPVIVVILRRLLSIIASLYLNDKSHIKNIVVN